MSQRQTKSPCLLAYGFLTSILQSRISRSWMRRSFSQFFRRSSSFSRSSSSRRPHSSKSAAQLPLHPHQQGPLKPFELLYPPHTYILTCQSANFFFQIGTQSVISHTLQKIMYRSHLRILSLKNNFQVSKMRRDKIERFASQRRILASGRSMVRQQD